MAIIGTVLPQAFYVQVETTGVGTAYASKALFLAAGHTITWQNTSGVALSSQPTWDISAGTADGRHVLNYTNPSGEWTAKIVPASGFVISPVEFSGEGLSTDLDTLYVAFLNSLGGVSATQLTTTGDVIMYDGNSIYIELTVLDAALAAIGATSLANCDSRVAEIKIDTADSDDPATVASLTEAIVTDTPGAYLVSATLDAFPAALHVPDGAKSLEARCDLLLTKGAKSITASTRDIQILWKANT